MNPYRCKVPIGARYGTARVTCFSIKHGVSFDITSDGGQADAADPVLPSDQPETIPNRATGFNDLMCETTHKPPASPQF